MNILLIGSGGREHALALKLTASPLCDKLFALPGNPGIGEIAENIEGISITDGEAILKLAKEKEIGLVVVGPELPLTEGVADVLTAGGVKVFGPSKAATISPLPAARFSTMLPGPGFMSVRWGCLSLSRLTDWLPARV